MMMKSRSYSVLFLHFSTSPLKDYVISSLNKEDVWVKMIGFEHPSSQPDLGTSWFTPDVVGDIIIIFFSLQPRTFIPKSLI